jgi:hypothetical protein
VDFKFDRVQSFSEGLAAVRVGDRWGFIDRTGRMVIPARFEEGPTHGPPIGSFKKGLAAVYENGSWQFIDVSGGIAIAGQFQKVGSFRDGVVDVCGKKSCGYIDRTGRLIWPWR